MQKRYVRINGMYQVLMKNPPGRPCLDKSGPTEKQVAIRVSAKLVKAIEAFRKREKLSGTSDAVRELVWEGLAAKGVQNVRD